MSKQKLGTGLMHMLLLLLSAMITIMWIILDGNIFCYTRREPVGVVGAITPVFFAHSYLYSD